MTAPAVKHPNTVGAVITYLDVELNPVPVSSKIPPTRPAKFVTVQRTGGPQATLVSDRPQITIEAWADDDIEAQDLANECRRLLHAMADGSNRSGVIVYRCDEFAGPGYLPEPDSRQDRFTFTVSLHVRTAPA